MSILREKCANVVYVYFLFILFFLARQRQQWCGYVMTPHDIDGSGDSALYGYQQYLYQCNLGALKCVSDTLNVHFGTS